MEMTNWSDRNIDTVHIPGYKHVKEVHHLIRLESYGNYTRLYLANKTTPLLSSETLRYFEEVLEHFIRIHKSVLINPAYVREVIDEGSKQLTIVLLDDTIIEVSRRRISETKAKLFHYQYDGSKRIWTFSRQPVFNLPR